MKLAKTKQVLVFILCGAFSLSLFAVQGRQFIDDETRLKTEKLMVSIYGQEQAFRISRGIDQVARLWQEQDGSKEVFIKYCQKSFVADPVMLDKIFKKFEFYSEVLAGHFNEMMLDLTKPLQLDLGEILPVDMSFGQLDPSAHIREDLFKNKIAFYQLLNFPRYTLEEMAEKGENWSRKEWAYARLGRSISSRVPAELNQEASTVMTKADTYISGYNIFMGNLVDKTFKTFFPGDLKLITHWGLRDEISARYNDPKGLYKQEMIYKVMGRIIDQSIPQNVINNKDLQWDPFANKVYKGKEEVSALPEPNTRYIQFMNVANVIQKMDPYNPYYENYIKRYFQGSREISETHAEKMFIEILSSKEVRKVGKLIKKRLKRKLRPFDLWYPGFQNDSPISAEELDKIVSQKYPNIKAFEKDIKNILVKLGFEAKLATHIASFIQVDPARGAGHCAGALMKTAKVRLRTRVPKGGMDYKGFNTAMHELGHATEQVLTMHHMDHFYLSGVPNNGFTEAFAFVFQARDLDVLGIERDQKRAHSLRMIDTLWDSYECVGISLLDMKVWRWLYENPKATPQQLKETVIKLSKDIWNKYYADVFGIRDQDVLAIYSHMIAYPLYLPDYSIGFIIQFQVEDYLQGKNLGEEMPRMCASGNVLPNTWMKAGVKAEISVAPMMRSVGDALKIIKK